MSIIWDLKKIDLSSKTNNKKLFKSRKIGTLLLTKSNSFNNIKSQKNISNKYNIRKLSINKNCEKIKKKEEKLRDKNTRLKIKLNNINKELILAKSASHKKIFKLQQNNRLLSTAINIKKLTLDYEQNNLTSSNVFNKQRENDITIKGFKSNLIHNIRKQYFDLEKDNKNKKIILSDLKNNINTFNKNELISKNKGIMDKLIDLKNKYDEDLEQNNGYKLKMKEYIELEENLNKKNFCILELKETLNNINCINMNLENDIENLKNKLKRLEIENENLNNEYYFLNERVIQASNDKNELENKYGILYDENKDKNENYNFQNLE